MFRRLLIALTFCALSGPSFSQESPGWFQNTTSHLANIWEKGSYEVYVPAYAYHMPFAYSQDKISQYNELPWGLGLGKGLINESGNWEGIYGMAFKDSHNVFEYMVGYGWIPMWNIGGNPDWKYGAGGTVFLMSRQDIMNYVPFPGILPAVSLSYKDVSVQAAYIPGGRNIGNVLFAWAKFTVP